MQPRTTMIPITGIMIPFHRQPAVRSLRIPQAAARPAIGCVHARIAAEGEPPAVACSHRLSIVSPGHEPYAYRGGDVNLLPRDQRECNHRGIRLPAVCAGRCYG